MLPLMDILPTGAFALGIECANQAIASRPFLLTKSSSFSAGPLGCFLPLSHLLIVPVVTVKYLAKTAWLTPALVLTSIIFSGGMASTAVRHDSSNFRIVLAVTMPISCKPLIDSCIAANASLLYFFGIVFHLYKLFS